jgi:PAS domain S-box-containing protein
VTPRLRILLLEDDPADAGLVRELLEADQIACDITRVQTRGEFEAGLAISDLDLILADFRLPAFDGLAALDLAVRDRPDLPFIFVSGTLGEETAIDALKRGATDYVLKTRLSRLVPSVRRALREAGERADRKRAEDELRQSESRLGEAQRIAHVGWWERDLVTNQVSLSDETRRIFGVQPVDLPDWHGRWLDLIHPQDRAKAAMAAAAALLPDGARYDIEYRVIRPDGTERTVHSQGNVIRDQNGQPLRQFGVLQDITELRQAERELRASEQRFRTFVDNATDAFFLIDDHSKVLDVNRQACESLGYSREELIGGHRNLFDVGLDEASIARLKQRIAAGETVTFETRHRRKDGSSFPVEARVGHFEQGGRRFLCLVRDITERKRAEEALRVLEADLAHMNRLSIMGELTASLAHEVLHPIAATRNNARAAVRFLDKNPPDLAEVREALDCIVRDADRAKEIVGRVRDHIKKAPPRLGPFDLNQAIGEVIGMVRDTIDRNRVALRADLFSGLVPVHGDRVQLQQVVLNLMLNAIEAMSSDADRARELSIVTEPGEAGGILVAVSDSGPGIRRDNLEQIFQPFYTTKSSGIGMGLSICRSIIVAHGGRLWADTDQPRGATFRFSLPAAQ